MFSLTAGRLSKSPGPDVHHHFAPALTAPATLLRDPLATDSEPCLRSCRSAASPVHAGRERDASVYRPHAGVAGRGLLCRAPCPFRAALVCSLCSVSSVVQPAAAVEDAEVPVYGRPGAPYICS